VCADARFSIGLPPAQTRLLQPSSHPHSARPRWRSPVWPCRLQAHAGKSNTASEPDGLVARGRRPRRGQAHGRPTCGWPRQSCTCGAAADGRIRAACSRRAPARQLNWIRSCRPRLSSRAWMLASSAIFERRSGVNGGSRLRCSAHRCAAVVVGRTDGSRPIEPAHVGWVVGPDGWSRSAWMIIEMIKVHPCLGCGPFYQVISARPGPSRRRSSP
jgi:hypothetical protein